MYLFVFDVHGRLLGRWFADDVDLWLGCRNVAALVRLDIVAAADFGHGDWWACRRWYTQHEVLGCLDSKPANCPYSLHLLAGPLEPDYRPGIRDATGSCAKVVSITLVAFNHF
jgi:hypothetical protein